MDEDKKVISSITSETYDASEQPFDFVSEGQETALVCESDKSLQLRTADLLKEAGYLVSPADTGQEALRKMRYHDYDLVVVNELFDCLDSSSNLVLAYLEGLNMKMRRWIYVVLVGSGFRTMDRMTAFNRSVNLTVNIDNIDEIGAILNRGIAEYRSFYSLFEEILAGVEGRR